MKILISYFLVCIFIVALGQNKKFYYLLNSSEDVYAIDLDGSTERAITSTNSNLNFGSTPFSLVAWVTSTSSATYRIIMSRTVGTGLNQLGWWLGVSSGNKAYISLHDTTVAAIASTPSINDGAWHLIVFTYDPSGGANNAKLYVDAGVSNNTTAANYNMDNTQQLGVSRQSYTDGSYWVGRLGQIQVVSGYALTTTEISNLYSKGGMLLSSYGSGTVVSWYKWDNNLLTDYASGNNLTGTNITTDDQVKIGQRYK